MERRLPCLLLLDISRSMDDYRRLRYLEQAIRTQYPIRISENEIARETVYTAIMVFNDRATLLQDFVKIDQFITPTLSASGNTRLGHALAEAFKLITAYKAHLRAEKIGHHRPIILLFTDADNLFGETMEEFKKVTVTLQNARIKQQVDIHAFGIGDLVDTGLLQLITPQVNILKGETQIEFMEIMKFLSGSIEDIAINNRIIDFDESVSPPTDESVGDSTEK